MLVQAVGDESFMFIIMFQYILCVGSRVGYNILIKVVNGVSIHLMCWFKTLLLPITLIVLGFNTSYVLVQAKVI